MATKVPAVKYHAASNPELSKAMRGFNSSSAADPHGDSRTTRARTRAASKARAIREY